MATTNDDMQKSVKAAEAESAKASETRVTASETTAPVNSDARAVAEPTAPVSKDAPAVANTQDAQPNLNAEEVQAEVDAELEALFAEADADEIPDAAQEVLLAQADDSADDAPAEEGEGEGESADGSAAGDGAMGAGQIGLIGLGLAAAAAAGGGGGSSSPSTGSSSEETDDITASTTDPVTASADEVLEVSGIPSEAVTANAPSGVTFKFTGDAEDKTLELDASSELGGDVVVENGTVDVSLADVSAVTSFTANSSLVITPTQLEALLDSTDSFSISSVSSEESTFTFDLRTDADVEAYNELVAEGGLIVSGSGADSIKFGVTDANHSGDADAETAAATELPVLIQNDEAFTLTTSVDDIRPDATASRDQTTENNDTIKGVVDDTSSNDSVNANDEIDGGEGLDTLAVSVLDATSDETVSPIMSSVETVEVTNEDQNDAFIFNAFNVDDLNTVSSLNSLSSSETTFDNLDSLDIEVLLDGADGKTTAVYNDSLLTGGGDEVNVEIRGASDAALVVEGTNTEDVETLNIDSLGSTANTLDLDESGNTLSEINVSGVTDINLSTLRGGRSVEVDASELTGKLTVNLDTADDHTITGGSGNDVITTDKATDANDSFTGGSGEDTFRVTDAAAISDDSTDADSIATDTTFSGIETFEFIDSAGGSTTDEFDADALTSFDNVVFRAGSDNSDVSVIDALSGSTYTFQIDNGAGYAFNEIAVAMEGTADGASDSVTLNLTNKDLSAAEEFDTVTATNFETINLNATSEVDHTGHDIDVRDIAGTAVVNLTGTADVRLGAGSAIDNSEVDASELDGTLDIAFASGDQDITGSSNADNFVVGGGTVLSDDQVIDGGEGVDTFEAGDNTLDLTSAIGSGDVSGIDRVTVNNASNNTITLDDAFVEQSDNNSVTVEVIDNSTSSDSEIEVDADVSDGNEVILSGALSDQGPSDEHFQLADGGNRVTLADDPDGDAETDTGLTVELGNGADIVTGGTSDDTFETNAVDLRGDTITGGGGDDTLNIDLDGDVTGDTDAPTVEDVDSVNITALDSAKTLDLQNFSNVGTVDLKADGQDVIFLNAAADQQLRLVTDDGNEDFGDDTISVNASGDEAATVTIVGDIVIGDAIIKTGAGEITVDNDTGVDGDTDFRLKGTGSEDVTKLTLEGGIAGKTTTVDDEGDVALTSLDAAGLSGDLTLVDGLIETGASGGTVDLADGGQKLTVAAADLTNLTVNGGDGADELVATGLDKDGTYSIKTVDVETLDLTLNNSGANETVIDLDESEGLETVKLDLAAVENPFEIKNADTVTTYELKGVADSTTDVVKLSSSDTVTVQNQDDNSLGDTNTILDLADATTATISQGGQDEAIRFDTLKGANLETLTVDTSDESATTRIDKLDGVGNLSSLVLTAGAGDIRFADDSTFTADNLSSITASGSGDVTIGSGTASSTESLSTIDAAAVTGAVTVGSGVELTNTAEITTGEGDDNVSLSFNGDEDVALDMGEASGDNDTLTLTGSVGTGTTIINLTNTGDEITQVNGNASNEAEQTGIESVDATALSDGTAGSGVSFTGNDQANTFVESTAADTVNLGSGDDTYVQVTDTADDNVDAGAGTDALALQGGVDINGTSSDIDDFANYSNFEKLTAFEATSSAIDFEAHADFASDTGITTIDFSADTNATGDNVIDMSEEDSSSVDFDITGSAGKDTITGGDGDDTITGGAGNDVLTGDAGADTFVFGSGMGEYTITDFAEGASADVIDGLEDFTTDDSTFTKITDLSATIDAGDAGVASIAVNVATSAADMDAADFNTAFTGTIDDAEDGETMIAIVSADYDATDGGTDAYMYQLEHDGTEFDGVTLLATLSGIEVDNLTEDNFDGYAAP